MSETKTRATDPSGTWYHDGTPAVELTSVTDSRGRVILFKTLSLMEQMDLMEAAGELAENTRWMALARVASMVVKIDQQKYAVPKNREGIRGKVAVLGSEGVNAILAALAPAAATDADAGEIASGEESAAGMSAPPAASPQAPG